MQGAWEVFREEFRKHPVRMIVRLAVVVYVAGLIGTLALGVFDQTPTMVFREP